MDIISHGLYGGVLVGRRSRKSFWTSCFFGIAPDLFSFGIFTASIWLQLASGPDWSSDHPDVSQIPDYVNLLYGITHSLVIFALVFLIVWFIKKKPVWEMLAWGFHVVLDIFTHNLHFFPTPFLWPISGYYFNGHSWGTLEVFIPNLTVLAILYGWWWFQKRKKRATS
ncbi:MAG: hypothetical protein A2845_00625 [Candidatus Lloydbacteria bacterium RIFCSPHIGHO2_01_FULL_49_22]|uniref:Uncharacterized protein n=1 Tax=Candidatus Lloydbacteria bacterium RIFCSPHIGHO2_01_FULL_49_22 TaxID=1798658 RepID=A0A1G2CY49_9BACT|nr:MAG: hypothetical protein A2845_00625 [Candidatus Lloydbacteria bacterium RIFCSPHIGHO2_01_FULL_49_22]OGZ09367.1 MAG: hypothetical protein A3C14_05530 [Candidatus Lloydbacteria bacterium RIFCSPHIGHO2_02_FULL_50_18]